MPEDPRSPQLTYPLEADILVPAQWSTPRPALPESERRLRAAILEDALRYYRDYRGSSDRRARAIHEDAVEWFASTDRSEPFAFENVCDALGLDANAIRRGLRPSSAPARLRVVAPPDRHAA